jgi:hypothetical protein
MASTYINDLRLNEMATGDGSGTWGTTTNTNLELIAEAFSYGTEVITTNADTHTTTIADGATDPGRSMYLKYTGTLDSACTITIGPNTVSKVWIIENGTSGSQNIIISQGSGANITIPAGDTKVVYSDGAGAGAAFVDAFASLSVVDLKVQDDLTVTDDASIGGDATITGTLGVTGVFTGTSLDISGDIDVDGTTNLDVVDIDGAVDMASTLAVAGVLTGASLDISGDIDVDGTTNLDIVDIDGAVDFASTTAHAGDATFADNAKAIFGAGSDLQIYHDGSNTFINEGGTGSLYIQARDLYLRDYDTSASFINMLNNGAVTLHHAGNAKLATTATGIDVTGGVNSTGGMFCDLQAQLGRTTLITAVFGDAGNVGNKYIRTTHAGASRTDIPAINALNAGVGGSSLYIQSDGSDTLIGGNLLVGRTSAVGKVDIESSKTHQLYINGLTGVSNFALFDFNGATVGSISTNGVTTSYNTSSDQRLKENIADANDAGDKIDAIKVRQYDWKADGSHQDYGMIAQELQTVAPEAVSGDADSEEIMGVDYSKLVPMLVKEIQSLRTRITALES